MKKFKEAVKWKAKHEEIFQLLSATFATGVVGKWTSMVESWEANPSAPNPYEELDAGNKVLLHSIGY